MGNSAFRDLTSSMNLEIAITMHSEVIIKEFRCYEVKIEESEKASSYIYVSICPVRAATTA